MSHYDTAANRFDQTRSADPYIAGRLIRALRPRRRRRYLDLGCGTGNYTLAFAAAGGCWYGLDINHRMLRQAQMKSGTVRWTQGSAIELPFEDDCFSGISTVLSLHHYDRLPQACAEIKRVVGKGRFACFASSREQAERYWIWDYFPTMKQGTLETTPNAREMKEALEAAGFARVVLEPYSIHDGLRDHFLYCGKHRPALYLCAEIRRSISNFSGADEDGHFAEGLARLKRDIECGAWQHHLEASEQNLGDYLFITADGG